MRRWRSSHRLLHQGKAIRVRYRFIVRSLFLFYFSFIYFEAVFLIDGWILVCLHAHTLSKARATAYLNHLYVISAAVYAGWFFFLHFQFVTLKLVIALLYALMHISIIRASFRTKTNYKLSFDIIFSLILKSFVMLAPTYK